MNSAPLVSRFIGTLPVGWARIYTFGLPEDQRQARLLQIRSDVYEHMADARATNASLAASLEILACLMASIYDDLTWRLSPARPALAAAGARSRSFPRASVALLGLAAAVAFVRLSSVHHLPEREHLLLIAAVVLGPALAGVASEWCG